MRAMSAAVTPPPADRPVTDDADLFLQTVPRTLVHRAAVSEVLMTGLRVLGDASFRLGAHWPREHSFYSPVARRWQDPIFPANFPWFGSSDYWRGQVDMLIEQIEAMQEDPLVA